MTITIGKQDDNIVLAIQDPREERKQEDGRPKVLLLIYLLVTLFGCGSWVAMNGIWVELPNLVPNLPEGWTLPSYLAVICQLANVGPITYTVLHNYVKNKGRLLHVVVYMSVSVGVVACVLLAFTWETTAIIFNKRVSVALLGSTFLLALVDCTSSLTFLPYMAILPSVYLSPFYVGETMSGLLPGLLALVQGVEVSKLPDNSTNDYYLAALFNSGVEEHDRSNLFFPQEMFFSLLGLLMLLCLIAFLCLNKLPTARSIHLSAPRADNNVSTAATATNNADAPPPFYNSCSTSRQYQNGTGRDIMVLLFILTLLNAFQNGITASTSSFTYAPYGSLTYHLAATLASISSSLACFLYLWYPFNSKRTIYINTIIYTLLVVYTVVLATQSPNPWLKNTWIGKVIVVLVSVISSSLVSFTKLAIASVMKECGQKHLFRAGVSNQVGSFVGAVVMFPLINFTKVFSM